MENAVIAVSGVSGLLGQRLMPLLDADDAITRVIGIDVREPARHAAKLEFHRADIPGGDLLSVLDGADVVVHLAALRDPLPDDNLARHVNIDGMRSLTSAAAAAGVRVFVRLSSAAVYGAHADNPVPLTETDVIRPNPGFLPAAHDAECERLLFDWGAGSPDRRAVVLRLAPVLGPGPLSLLARAATGRLPLHVTDAASRAVQLLHVDDAAAAIAHAISEPLDGVYNVAADSWLEASQVAALVQRHRTPVVPEAIAQRTLAGLWSTGLGDTPPSVTPLIVHPFVIATDKLTATGWSPRHSNEEAILLTAQGGESGRVGWVAAAVAIVAGAGVATLWMRHRRRK